MEQLARSALERRGSLRRVIRLVWELQAELDTLAAEQGELAADGFGCRVFLGSLPAAVGSVLERWQRLGPWA